MLQGVVFRFLGLMAPAALGILFSWLHGDWAWLSRSGALIVAFSILTFALAYVDNAAQSIIEFRERVLSKKELNDVKSGDGSFDASMKRFKRSLMNYNAATYAAFCGTLIWGFGDLVDLIF